MDRRQFLASGAAFGAASMVSAHALAQGAKPLKIGILNDLSTIYSDYQGVGSKIAADMAISDPYFNRLMVSARIAKQFYVDLGSPVEYAMPELENEHRRREQLKKLESSQVSPAVRGKIVDRLEA